MQDNDMQQRDMHGEASNLIRNSHGKVGVAECVPDSDTLCRVKCQELLDEIQKSFVYRIHWGDHILINRRSDWILGSQSVERTCKGRVARTSFLLCRVVDLGLGQSSFAPSLKNSGFDLAPARAKRSGILPITASIMARCSRLSCVWYNATPVKNSTRMQPKEYASQG